MGKIVITTNATLDGVVEDPDGKEGSERGGWFYGSGEADVPSWDVLSTQQAMAAEALCWAGEPTPGSAPESAPANGRRAPWQCPNM